MDFKNTFKGRRVLVTGDTGFKGSWLCEWLLSEGAEVYGLGLAPNTEPSLFDQLNLAKRISHVELDIRDATALADYIDTIAPEIVLHLAAQPLVRLSYDIPVETYSTNVMGTVHLLDAIRKFNAFRSGAEQPVSVVCVTTDKCYENKEWLHSYREEDPVGGHDPYSSSKGACEIAIQSFRKSYFSNPAECGVAVASARAGNVIGGGDWALDRIIPDCVTALRAGAEIPVRNKVATRPWQHVLEPLGGYLLLAAELWRGLSSQAPLQANFDYRELCGAFNFGPNLQSNRTVKDLVEEVLKHWKGTWRDQSEPNALHEASLLNLSVDKAFHVLNWSPRWGFAQTIQETIEWYAAAESSEFDAQVLTREQIRRYQLSA
ncbi:MAG: CDP-glucose 4,6-dehydratase [Verrucomicrobiota bacterium]